MSDKDRKTKVIDTGLIIIIAATLTISVGLGLFLRKYTESGKEIVSDIINDDVISAGIISRKEIINGHNIPNPNGGRIHIPTTYNIYIISDSESEDSSDTSEECYQVTEDIFNSYQTGDYFDYHNLK